jgi:hypothetical protein
MTYEEAKQQAIREGVLRPQNASEQLAHNIDTSNGGLGWAYSPTAQYRLDVRIKELMAGAPARAAVGGGGCAVILATLLLPLVALAIRHV